MIQIICDEDGNPLETGYSQHYNGETKSWSNTPKENGHPKVYIAKGGHASFHTEKKYSLTDPRGDFGENHILRNGEYNIIPITNEDWLNFKGKWGEDGGSPNGPVFRYSKHGSTGAYWGKQAYIWIEPLYWKSVI